MPSSVDAPPDLSGLLELSRIEHLDLKPVILRVQTDLFVRAASRDRAAIEIFESLACGLIPTVDEDTARIVAGKLAAFPETPHSVLEALCARGGVARDLVIAQAPALSPSMMAAALADERDSLARLAATAALGRPVLDELSRDGRPEIDLALAANLGIALRGEALARLVGRGRHHADLARLLLARPDVSPADLVPLYLHADPIRREAVGRSVEATAALRPCPPAPRGLGETLGGLSAAGDVPGFVAALADGLGIARDFLGCVADTDARYTLLSLGLRAAGLHEEEAASLFLALNRGVSRSADRVSDLVRVFQRVSRPAARDLIAAILDRPLSERNGAEAHQPHHGPEAKLRQPAEHAASRRPTLPVGVRRGGRDAG